MKYLIFISLLLVLLPSVFAQVASQEVSIDISKNDIITQDVALTIIADQNYNSMQYALDYEPIAIISEHEYSYNPTNQLLTIYQPLNPGENQVNFRLIFDNLIDRSGKSRIFSTSFEQEQLTPMNISITLPEEFVLSEKDPAVSPKPAQISTNGRQLTLEWKDSYQRLDLIVLYKGNSFNFIPILIIFILIAIALMFFLRNKTDSKVLRETLGSEELLVVDQLKAGKTTQKEIAAELDFSKSKMSKVIRKLEEKKVIVKQPFFKTNKIKLNKNWK